MREAQERCQIYADGFGRRWHRATLCRVEGKPRVVASASGPVSEIVPLVVVPTWHPPLAIEPCYEAANTIVDRLLFLGFKAEFRDTLPPARAFNRQGAA